MSSIYQGALPRLSSKLSIKDELSCGHSNISYCSTGFFGNGITKWHCEMMKVLDMHTKLGR